MRYTMKYKHGTLLNFIVNEWLRELSEPTSIFYEKGKIFSALLRLDVDGSLFTNFTMDMLNLFKKTAKNKEIFCYTTRELSEMMLKKQQKIHKKLMRLKQIFKLKTIIVSTKELKRNNIKTKDKGYGRWVYLPPRTKDEQIEELFIKFPDLVRRDFKRGRISKNEPRRKIRNRNF